MKKSCHWKEAVSTITNSKSADFVDNLNVVTNAVEKKQIVFETEQDFVDLLIKLRYLLDQHEDECPPDVAESILMCAGAATYDTSFVTNQAGDILFDPGGLVERFLCRSVDTCVTRSAAQCCRNFCLVRADRHMSSEIQIRCYDLISNFLQSPKNLESISTPLDHTVQLDTLKAILSGLCGLLHIIRQGLKIEDAKMAGSLLGIVKIYMSFSLPGVTHCLPHILTAGPSRFLNVKELPYKGKTGGSDAESSCVTGGSRPGKSPGVTVVSTRRRKAKPNKAKRQLKKAEEQSGAERPKPQGTTSQQHKQIEQQQDAYCDDNEEESPEDTVLQSLERAFDNLTTQVAKNDSTQEEDVSTSDYDSAIETRSSSVPDPSCSDQDVPSPLANNAPGTEHISGKENSAVMKTNNAGPTPATPILMPTWKRRGAARTSAAATRISTSEDSSSELSETTSSPSNRRIATQASHDRAVTNIQRKIRATALEIFETVLKSTDRKLIFGFWFHFLPDASSCQIQAGLPTLMTLLVKEPNFRVRLGVVRAVNSLLAMSKPFLMLAEGSKKVLSFTPVSVLLANSVIELHRVLLLALAAENNTLVRIQILKCVAVLVVCTSYERVDPLLMDKIDRSIRGFLFYNEANIRVAALTIYNALLSRFRQCSAALSKKHQTGNELVSALSCSVLGGYIRGDTPWLFAMGLECVRKKTMVRKRTDSGLMEDPLALSTGQVSSAVPPSQSRPFFNPMPVRLEAFQLLCSFVHFQHSLIGNELMTELKTVCLDVIESDDRDLQMHGMKLFAELLLADIPDKIRLYRYVHSRFLNSFLNDYVTANASDDVIKVHVAIMECLCSFVSSLFHSLSHDEQIWFGTFAIQTLDCATDLRVKKVALRLLRVLMDHPDVLADRCDGLLVNLQRLCFDEHNYVSEKALGHLTKFVHIFRKNDHTFANSVLAWLTTDLVNTNLSERMLQLLARTISAIIDTLCGIASIDPSILSRWLERSLALLQATTCHRAQAALIYSIYVAISADSTNTLEHPTVDAITGIWNIYIASESPHVRMAVLKLILILEDARWLAVQPNLASTLSSLIESFDLPLAPLLARNKELCDKVYDCTAFSIQRLLRHLTVAHLDLIGPSVLSHMKAFVYYWDLYKSGLFAACNPPSIPNHPNPSMESIWSPTQPPSSAVGFTQSPLKEMMGGASLLDQSTSREVLGLSGLCSLTLVSDSSQLTNQNAKSDFTGIGSSDIMERVPNWKKIEEYFEVVAHLKGLCGEINANNEGCGNTTGDLLLAILCEDLY